MCVKSRLASCGFQAIGLPCPLQPGPSCFETPTEAPDSRYSLDPYPLTTTSSFPNLGALSLSLPSIKQPHEKLQPHAQREMPVQSPLLALPGEIRNRIYQYALITSQPFAVQLQFAPLDTALLRVNKQIHAEASSIFYHENTFRFSQALFVGAEILPQLEKLYHVSPTRLRTMRKFVFDVPIYGPASGERLRDQSNYNLLRLTEFLTQESSSDLRIELRLRCVWGEDIRRLDRAEYFSTLSRAMWLQGKVKEVHVWVTVHPRDLDEWVDCLSGYFGSNWSMECFHRVGSMVEQLAAYAAVSRFRERYQMSGLKEFYKETWVNSSYVFSPLRFPSSGACADKTAEALFINGSKS